jgi:hypothetical protein
MGKGNRGLRGGRGSDSFICASAYGLRASLRQSGIEIFFYHSGAWPAVSESQKTHPAKVRPDGAPSPEWETSLVSLRYCVAIGS